MATNEASVAAGAYRYRIKSTGGSSQKYGPCEVCAKPSTEVFIQSEEQSYARDEDEGGGIGWTHYDCHNLFGHEACLLSARREVQP
jgi:hypothetical protein